MNTHHPDHLGTPQVITDNAQTLVWQADYDPFGKATITTELITNNLRFPGQYFDSETNLHYNYFRTYDPSIGRYITSDPIGLDGGLNTYWYTGNNPINYIDQFGNVHTNKISPTQAKPWKGTELPGYPAGSVIHCIERCLYPPVDLLVSGGSECTTDGRHQPGRDKGSKHCTNQAFDIPNSWRRSNNVDRKALLCCALLCGVKYAEDEGSHIHFQTTPGRYGGKGILPERKECAGECF